MKNYEELKLAASEFTKEAYNGTPMTKAKIARLKKVILTMKNLATPARKGLQSFADAMPKKELTPAQKEALTKRMG